MLSAGCQGAWTPIGAVQTASGYDVAWQLTGTYNYTIWSTDRNGNYTANLVGVVSGNSAALESFETLFNQGTRVPMNFRFGPSTATAMNFATSTSYLAANSTTLGIV